MSRVTPALEALRGYRWVAFAARQASAFWSLQIDPVVDPTEDRDAVVRAELESYFWRAERRQAAW